MLQHGQGGGVIGRNAAHVHRGGIASTCTGFVFSSAESYNFSDAAVPGTDGTEGIGQDFMPAIVPSIRLKV